VSANAELFLTPEGPSVESDLQWWERRYSDWGFAVASSKFPNDTPLAALSVLPRIPALSIHEEVV